MIPKVRAALDALARDVTQVRIVNLAGLSRGGGTVFAGERAAYPNSQLSFARNGASAAGSFESTR